MFSITILAPEPPAFTLTNVFRSPTIQKYDNVQGLKIQKTKRLRIKRMRLNKISNISELSGSLLSIRSYKIFNDGPLTQNLLCTYCIFIVITRVARIATQNLSFTTNSAACFLSLTRSSTRAIHSTNRVD